MLDLSGDGPGGEVVVDLMPRPSADVVRQDMPEAQPPEEDVAETQQREEEEDLPWANVFLSDPYEDNGKTTPVQLKHITSPDGALTGPYADVSNCLQEDGGAVVGFDTGLDYPIQICHEVQTVFPDKNGNYIKIYPPKKYSDGNDQFAEVMGYYQVNAMHDYFHDVHGHTQVDVSLYTLVNFQFSVGAMVWFAFDNAAYLPEGSLEDLGVNLKYDDDLIVMGQGEEVDYSYDGDVIRHEYTHFAVGGNRLAGYSFDEYGFDASPLSLNEALADFFPSSMSGDPVLGAYSLGGSARDLTEIRKCPEDVMGEAHYDGQIASSALWHLRALIGKEKTERIAYAAMFVSGASTDFEEFGLNVLDAAADLYPEVAPVAEQVLRYHGVLGCLRIVPGCGEATKKKTILIPGKWTSGIDEFHKYVPAPIQYVLAARSPEDELNVRAVAGVAGMAQLLGGGDEPNVWLAVRHAAPVRYEFTPDAEMVRDVLVKPKKLGGDVYGWTLPARSLPAGTWYLQFINFTDIDVAISGVEIR